MIISVILSSWSSRWSESDLREKPTGHLIRKQMVRVGLEPTTVAVMGTGVASSKVANHIRL